jgi:endonuclease/exonuclease/phosphatase family metal-dependent hydrolase
MIPLSRKIQDLEESQTIALTQKARAMKLDGIYTRGFVTRKFATADAQNVSDHLALWATMSFSGN